MLRKICEGITSLSGADIRRLERIEAQLPLMAELTGSDVFIDCFLGEDRAVVAAHAKPMEEGRSSYQGDITGQYALPDREPAVFRAKALGTPIRELKAITQENKTVRQFVVPVFGDGRVIAVLLQEKDISDDLRQKKKYEELAKAAEKEGGLSVSAIDGQDQRIMLREVNHRIKNNLQLIASMLNLQARRCRDRAAADILRENAARILSIAASHDIISSSRNMESLEISELLEKLRQNLQMIIPEEKKIVIELLCEPYRLDGDRAGFVALVVNELVLNAIEHAYDGRDSGTIRITFSRGSLYHTITVTDDGCGFKEETGGTGIGLKIAEATVKERLHGHLWIRSDGTGCRVSFDFEAVQD